MKDLSYVKSVLIDDYLGKDTDIISCDEDTDTHYLFTISDANKAFASY